MCIYVYMYIYINKYKSNHSAACKFPRLNAPAVMPLVPPASIAVIVDPPGRHRPRGERRRWRTYGGRVIRENFTLSRWVQMIVESTETRGSTGHEQLLRVVLRGGNDGWGHRENCTLSRRV